MAKPDNKKKLVPPLRPTDEPIEVGGLQVLELSEQFRLADTTRVVEMHHLEAN